MLSEDITAIVLDIGQNFVRSGYSSSEFPRIYDHSWIGQFNNQNSYLQDLYQQKEFKFNKILSKSQFNMEYLSDFISHIYTNLNVDPKEYPLLLAEPFLLHNREQLAQIMFEQLGVYNYFQIRSPILNSFALGKQTSLVIESNSDNTYIVPVYEGYCLQKNSQIIQFGGNYYNHQIIENKQFDLKSYQQMNQIQQFQQIQNIKESQQLPDGQQIEFSHDIEILTKSIFNSIEQSDIDIKKELYQNIIFTGGNSLMKNLNETLQQQIQEFSPPNSKAKIINSNDKKFNTFLGGSILTSLSSFQGMWITKQEYEEIGNEVILKKCL